MNAEADSTITSQSTEGAPPGVNPSPEGVCNACRGSGKVDGAACRRCQGSGEDPDESTSEIL